MTKKIMKGYCKKHLNLLKEIALTQYKLRDQSTALGFVWSFLNPLLMLTVPYIIFRFRTGQEVEYYSIYLVIGIIHYTHFSKSTSSSMRVLHSMKSLTTNAIFPKEILVTGSVMSGIPEFVISMTISVVIAFLVGVEVSKALVLLPVVLMLQFMLVLWTSFLLSCLYVFVRDIDHIYQVFLRILFFATPIFYTINFLGPTSRRGVRFNPLAHLIEFSRTIVIEGQLPSATLIFIFFLANAVLIYLCLRIFRKIEPRVIEYL